MMYVFKLISLLGGLALMTGMDMMSSSMEFLKNVPWFAQLMISFSNPLLYTVADMECTVGAYTNFDREQALKVEPQEQVIDTLVREIKSRHVRRLRDGLCTVEYGLVLEDLLTAYERTADHCSNVAVEILQVSEGKLEAHEYLNALKSGALEESAAYNRRFEQYKAQYTFPEE